MSQSDALIITSLNGGAGVTQVSTLSGMASAKVQLIPLAKAANQLQLGVRVLSLDIDKPSILNRLGTPSLCFISKINHYKNARVDGFAMAVLSAVSRLKAIGTKIVLLYCDNIASLPCSRGRLYRDLLRHADHCVVPSQSMSELVMPHINASTPISVIEDPSSVRLQPYRKFLSTQKLRIAWFGNTSNVFYVCAQLEQLMRTVSHADSIQLVILTNPNVFEMIEKLFTSLLPHARRPWSLELLAWDDHRQPQQLEDVLGSAHFAWLPSNPTDPLKAGVSHNRLVDSVLSGCIPIASEMQSYLELSKIALIGSDHGELINLALNQYQRLSDKHQRLRSPILERFSPQKNHQRWVDLLSDLLA